jgi:hypothetical protein
VKDRIETERLILRPFEASDAEAAFLWFGNAGLRVNLVERLEDVR